MGFQIIHFVSVTSTHEIAKGIMKENVVIVADEQRTSYGRRKRKWYSPPGGLWMSMILRTSLWDILTLAASVAVVKALNHVGVNTGIKWPNDIFYRGKKLGGIIAEKQGEFVILGIGLNLKNEIPEEIREIAINLPEVDRDTLLPIILEYMEFVLSLSKEDIIREWKRYSITLGRRVCVLDDGEICGIAKDIDAQGGLIIDRDGKKIHVYTGDLRFVD
jgi:BirA family biotin operon repressor/biotin-[acetyl-CoA-carboxylase] ligase